MSRTSRRPLRRGSMTVELIIIMPVMLVVVYLFVQMGLLMATTERLIAASQQGARTAARGGSEQDVRDAVRDVLGDLRFKKAEVVADLADATTGRPRQTGEPVEVTVKLKGKDAIAIPLLFGSNDELMGRSKLRKE